MKLRSFRLQCVLRVMLLTLTIFGFIYTLQINIPLGLKVVLSLAVIMQVFFLITYVERTNRMLTTFLNSIRYSEFSSSFEVKGLGSSFDVLKNSFNNVINDFQRISTDREIHYHYLKNVVEHVGIALLAFRSNGDVEIYNKAAQNLFRMDHLKNIHTLASFSRRLYEKIITLRSGEKAMVKIQYHDELLQLAMYATEFKLMDRKIILVSIQNIQSEMEEQELEAWQKLIRVLTHEIMNSITPIASLSSTINQMLDQIHSEICVDSEQEETFNDIHSAVRTIERRSSGLLKFVQSYRNLTRIPKPNFTIFSIRSLFDNLQNLFAEELQTAGIELAIKIIPEELELTADESMIEQILINLVQNAKHALREREHGRIGIAAFVGPNGRPAIQVWDNGSGILEDVIDKIFIPFFTTKPSGTGIGLALARQMMRLHGGTINVRSVMGVETIFTLKF